MGGARLVPNSLVVRRKAVFLDEIHQDFPRPTQQYCHDFEWIVHGNDGARDDGAVDCDAKHDGCAVDRARMECDSQYSLHLYHHHCNYYPLSDDALTLNSAD